MKEKILSLKPTVSKFALLLLTIETTALLPFAVKIFTGRAYVFWSHYGLSRYFWCAMASASLGLMLSFRLKNHSVGILAASILSVPIFLLPFFETAIIVSMPGF
jgi:hypothetical protein